MFRRDEARGFTLLEFLFASFLLAVLTTAGLFVLRHQSKSGLTQKTSSEMDHAAYSILAIISREIRSAGGFGGGAPPIVFVDGGGGVRKDGNGCDPLLAKKDGTDCITFESVSYDGSEAVKKTFFVDGGVLKIRNSDSSRTQSLTSADAGVKVEDFQIGFFESGKSDFQDMPENMEDVEAVKVSLTLSLHGFGSAPEIKTYSAVASPRNI